MKRDVKIAVIGLGGVGGYIGAALADTYENVSFAARGGRKESLEEKGSYCTAIAWENARHIRCGWSKV